MKDSKIKTLLLSVLDWYHIEKRYRVIKSKYKLHILNSKKTIEYIKKYNCSIARYGDGEFDIMYRRKCEDYQQFSDELSQALINVLENRSERLLICIPHPMISGKGLKKHAKEYWKRWLIADNNAIVTKKIIDKTGSSYIFGDSFVSRPYTAYKSKKLTKEIFALLKTIWEDKDIIIVEGTLTRLGVGNDLFSNTKSIKRILTPAENAFASYDTILQTIKDTYNGEMIIMACGPTATMLASDLSKENIQALDLGHVDIQYEWFLHGNDFQAVPGKYTNESRTKLIETDIVDHMYLSQIITDLS